jgi:hypothetical protein
MVGGNTAMSAKEFEVDAEYRHRMLVNALAATLITFLIVSGYWMVNTLTGVV